MNNSYIKTWFRRNGFKPHGKGANWRNLRLYQTLKRGNRLYRVKFKKGEVDISEPIEAFDRWANSIEKSMLIPDFMEDWK